jgi:hypothetical protein
LIILDERTGSFLPSIIKNIDTNTNMDTAKDEFNIPNIIIDPRTRTQYSKGKFLGKVSQI